MKKPRFDHRGVSLLKPNASSRTGWRAQYTDPDTGKRVKETLPDHLTTAEARSKWAVAKKMELAKRRHDLDTGAAIRATTKPLSEAIDIYFAHHPALSARTKEIYRNGADNLLGYLGAGYVAADLTRPVLMAYRAKIQSQPRKYAKPGAKPGTFVPGDQTLSEVAINQKIRSVKTVLRYLIELELLPKLTHDDLRRALKSLDEPAEEIIFLRQEGARQLLESAIRHDSLKFKKTVAEHRRQAEIGSTPRYRPFAQFTLFLLLTGMRIGEALGLEWTHVDTEHAEIRLPPSLTKTKRGRTIHLECSPSVIELLHDHRGDTKEGSVWNLTPGMAKRGMQRLLANGAPKGFTWHVARATCGSFLTNAPGIYGGASAYHSAARLGHSVPIAEKHYLGQIKGIPPEAKTLEQAMGIEDLVAEIVSRITG